MVDIEADTHLSTLWLLENFFVIEWILQHQFYMSIYLFNQLYICVFKRISMNFFTSAWNEYLVEELFLLTGFEAVHFLSQSIQWIFM